MTNNKSKEKIQSMNTNEGQFTLNDAKDLLKMLKKIKERDYLAFAYTTATEYMIWGLLMMLGGIFDFLIMINRSPPSPGPIPWILVVITGIIITNFLVGQPWFSKIPNKDIVKPLIITLITIFVSQGIAIYYRQFFLLMPIVGVVIGTYILHISFRETLPKEMNFKSFILFLPPMMGYISATINIVGYIVYGSFFVYFHSLIFGVLFGFSMVIVAYHLKNKITKYT